MKNLNITMTMKADSTNSAERLAMSELMHMAQIVGKHSGSMMTSGSGYAEHVSYDIYKVEAEVQVDGTGDVTDIIKETQMAWSTKPEIMNSMILVTETKPEVEAEPEPERKRCDRCGCVLSKHDPQYIVNKDMETEYVVCDVCFDDDDIVTCDICEHAFDDDELALNPVTCSYDLCPYCGNKLDV